MIRPKTLAAAALLCAALAMTACKGRTMENVEPNGETVSVSLHRIDREAAADTVAATPDSNLNP